MTYRVYTIKEEVPAFTLDNTETLLQKADHFVPLEDVQALQKTLHFPDKSNEEDANIFLLVDPSQVEMEDVRNADIQIGKKVHVIRRRKPWGKDVCPAMVLIGLNRVQELCAEDMGQLQPEDFKAAMEAIYG